MADIFQCSLKCIFNQLSQLGIVSACVPNRSCRHHWSSSILGLVRALQMLQDVPQPWLGVRPGTSILWLFLGPGYLGVAVFFQLSDNFLEWEWA